MEKSPSKRSRASEGEKAVKKRRHEEQPPVEPEEDVAPQEEKAEHTPEADSSPAQPTASPEKGETVKPGADSVGQETATREHSYQKESKDKEHVVKPPQPKAPETSESASRPGRSDTVLFRVHRTGDITSFLEGLTEECRENYLQELRHVREALDELKETEASPADKGLLSANVSFRFVTPDNQEIFAVLRSGMKADEDFNSKRDVCLVSKFDAKNWCAEYMSEGDEAMPTVDTPIHWACYKSNLRYKWPEAPNAIIHGHALHTEALASKLSLPITAQPSKGAAPIDAQALMGLFDAYPYPQHQVFIQRDHGFLLLAKDMKHALEDFNKTIVANV